MPGQFKAPHLYERLIGGDGCELTVCLPEADAGHREAECRYPTNEDLPAGIREAMPPVVQTLYREAYNAAWNRRLAPVRRKFVVNHDTVATRAAWKAVRRLYAQHGTTWVRRKPA